MVEYWQILIAAANHEWNVIDVAVDRVMKAMKACQVSQVRSPDRERNEQ
jgi:hypothetical protein